ncbi:zinc finger protein 92 homolog isoform X2 [Drosophila ficusphila]|uniref:zinc finger protein 92 homolog isoform X2 n=1 Tax=Drosophila ficusphila TaxID=30025 RepID=UPI0007E7AC0A|nr:zinc finger protein 92 homolog isoform X2 [Drosophila ficusphila]
MMNFSAFGGPFSGIHQFAAKFDAQTPGAFGTPPTAAANAAAAAAAAGTDNHVQRYQTNGNHFNQNVPNVSAANNMQYGQNISIPYSQPQGDLNFLNAAAAADHKVLNQQILQNVNQSWQTLANTANTVDYSSHLLSATLPISIQHFLKYSETIKKESTGDVLKNGTNLASLALGGVALTPSNNGANGGHHNGLVGMDHGGHMTNMTDANGAALTNGGASNGVNGNANGTVTNGGAGAVSSTGSVGTTNASGGTGTASGKKTKKKKPPKEKKPRPKPGEIRETKALDGSTLYCCPECQMAYPDRSLIEQHVISHAVERRFVCDICNAALKRKDHLTRHKLSHIPDRPHVCNICMKSFKRKEQLTLHIVIHSGEKKHVCIECGKGFYRKDHLRKHTRSHIARRVKSEVSAQNVNGSAGGGGSGGGGGANSAQSNALHGS